MHSCIYEGRVGHCRYQPVVHRFRYPLMVLYLDLDELPKLTAQGGLLSTARFSAASFHRSDHLGDGPTSLAESVRDLVAERCGSRPEGPIRLLTQLRYFGYYFSPLNLFYCYGEGGQRVQYVVAEVSNTPWNERHYYVLWQGNRLEGESRQRFRHPKTFHVSPFMGMDSSYDWRLNEPGDHLLVHLAASQEGQRLFDAAMTLRRRPLGRAELRSALVRYPFMTFRIMTAIYYQALRLWFKKVPFFPHPKVISPT
ncbi:MAG: DUF1365 domain-containing protein [Pirellulaceae bacterium]|nr:DUF1365 domain-containing protein [Pirellulaceae bacterium]